MRRRSSSASPAIDFATGPSSKESLPVTKRPKLVMRCCPSSTS